MLLIKIVLPPLEKYNIFHPANLHSIFSITISHIAKALEASPMEDPNISKEYRRPCI